MGGAGQVGHRVSGVGSRPRHCEGCDHPSFTSVGILTPSRCCARLSLLTPSASPATWPRRGLGAHASGVARVQIAHECVPRWAWNASQHSGSRCVRAAACEIPDHCGMRCGMRLAARWLPMWLHVGWLVISPPGRILAWQEHPVRQPEPPFAQQVRPQTLAQLRVYDTLGSCGLRTRRTRIRSRARANRA